MKKIITLLSVLAVSAIMSTAVMAEDETISGFYDIETKAGVEMQVMSGDTEVTAAEKNIDNDDAMENVYVGSDKINVTYSSATAENYYGIILVDGSGLPTKDTTVYYINQETATDSSVNFVVAPKLPAETTDMMLYISSSADDEDLVSVAMNYAVNATEVEEEPSYTLGDPNVDGAIDVKDVIIIRQYLAGGYDVTMVNEAADVNVDSAVDVKDVIMIRQYLAGGYDVEL